MCLTVDQISSGQDLIITGSKDHYIKVCIIKLFNYILLLNDRFEVLRCTWDLFLLISFLFSHF